MLESLLIVASMTLAAPPDGGGFDPFGAPQRQPAQLVTAEAIVDRSAVHGGETFMVAVTYSIAPHWHIYWENSGAAGMPTTLTAKAPSGWRVDAPRFPRPLAITEPEGVVYGYEKACTIFVPVTAPRELSGGSVTLEIDTSWLVCKDVCHLGSAELSVEVATAAGPAPRESAGAQHLQAAARRLPRTDLKSSDVTVEYDPDASSLHITGPGLSHDAVALFPVHVPGVAISTTEATVRHGRFSIDAKIEIKPANALGKPMSIRGLIVLGTKPTDPCYQLSIPLDSTGAVRDE